MELSNRRCILTRGIQGSGKSTWAKVFVAEDPVHRIRWNNDDIRNMLGPYWVPEREKLGLLDSMKEAFISRAIGCGLDFVIDDMNLNPKTVQNIIESVQRWSAINARNYIVEFKDFFIEVDECIRRDSLRDNPIGEKVIRSTYEKYKTVIDG